MIAAAVVGRMPETEAQPEANELTVQGSIEDMPEDFSGVGSFEFWEADIDGKKVHIPVYSELDGRYFDLGTCSEMAFWFDEEGYTCYARPI